MKKEISDIELFYPNTSHPLPLPFADEGIQAGFPNPAQDYIESFLDLNEALVRNPAYTFYGRVRGNSLIDANVDEGDILIIDKSERVAEGDMVVAFIDGEFTLKFIRFDKKDKDTIWLMPANSDFAPIKVTSGNEFIVWGVVTYTIKKRK